MTTIKEIFNNLTTILAWLVPGFAFLQCLDFLIWKKAKSLDTTLIVNSIVISFIINSCFGIHPQESFDNYKILKAIGCAILFSILAAHIYKKYVYHYSLGDNILRDYIVRNHKDHYIIADVVLKGSKVLLQGQITNVGVDETFFLQLKYYRQFQLTKTGSSMNLDFSNDRYDTSIFIKESEIESIKIRLIPHQKKQG